MITDTERATYEAVWTIPTYTARSPGVQYLDKFVEMCQPARGERILDAGCGAGVAGVELANQGYAVSLQDITDAGLTDEAKRLRFRMAPLWTKVWPDRCFEWVYCCDVLEHIPPTFTLFVVDRLLALSTRGVFLSISLIPDNYGAWVGTTLHQTVQPFTVWRDQLNTIAKVVECRDLIGTGLFYVRRADY